MASFYRILVLNICSTTTKVAFFENDRLKFQETIDYVSQQLRSITDYMEQFPLRKEGIEGFLAKHQIELSKLHMIVSRGGLTAPLSSGVYLVDEGMCEDLRSGKYGQHPTNLGPLIAHDLAKQASIRAVIVDSPSIDEYQPLARVSGIPEIQRKATSLSSALSAHSKTARRPWSIEFQREVDYQPVLKSFLPGFG